MPTHFPTVPVASSPRPESESIQEYLPPLALVVDDEPVIAETLAAILNGSGLAAMTETSGADALETAMLIPPEILITDFSMPGMNGLELAIKVKQRTPDCEVILFSGHAMASDVVSRAGELGLGFAMLVKPVHPVDLLFSVLDALARNGRALATRQPARNSSLYDYLATTRNERDRCSSTSGFTVRQRTRYSENDRVKRG